MCPANHATARTIPIAPAAIRQSNYSTTASAQFVMYRAQRAVGPQPIALVAVPRIIPQVAHAGVVRILRIRALHAPIATPRDARIWDVVNHVITEHKSERNIIANLALKIGGARAQHVMILDATLTRDAHRIITSQRAETTPATAGLVRSLGRHRRNAPRAIQMDASPGDVLGQRTARSVMDYIIANPAPCLDWIAQIATRAMAAQ